MTYFYKLINSETKQIDDITENENQARLIGSNLQTEEKPENYQGNWYLAGYAPIKPEQVREEIQTIRYDAYKTEVDPLMCEYFRKKTFNLFEEGEEEALLAEIEAKVAKIKEENPYPVEEDGVQ